jgi:hypothetical protein
VQEKDKWGNLDRKTLVVKVKKFKYPPIHLMSNPHKTLHINHLK